VKEQPKGAMARATAVAEGVATAVRRRQREREPRVLLYRHPGDPVVLAPGAKGHDRILDLAAEMVALVDSAAPEPRRRRPDRAEPGAGADGE
jgi:hypothetical protein